MGRVIFMGQQLNAWSVRQQQRMNLHALAGACLVLVAFVGLPSAADADQDFENPWDAAVRSRFPDLFACITPPKLRTKTISDIPPAYSETLGRAMDLSINDGCSIVVRTDSARRAVYLEAVGGIGGNLQLLFGPFDPDPTTF